MSAARIPLFLIAALACIAFSCAREERPIGPGDLKSPHQYEENAYAVSQGKNLFRTFNCNGCHGNGGGSYGPPLMDNKWRYGAAPDDVFATIMHGRPNGMPAFAGRIPEYYVWQLVAYVRSMSGQLRFDVAPSRADALSAFEPETRREKLPPVPEHVKPPQLKTPS